MLVRAGTFEWPVLPAWSLIQETVHQCSGFRRVMEAALRLRPVSRRTPWQLVLYMDELVAGNVLRPDPSRKVIAFYLSFLELGDWLHHEDSWITAAVIRCNVASKVIGGVSSCTRQLLLELFTGAGSFTDGFPLMCSSGSSSSGLLEPHAQHHFAAVTDTAA